MKGKIFNAQEVQAIIAGNKTQFREVCKIQPSFIVDEEKLNITHGSDYFKPKFKVGQEISVKHQESLITLKIKSVKVERLEDISEEDCYKSGVKCLAGEEIADTGDYFESEYYFGELKEKIKECGCIYGCPCNVYDFTSDFENTHDNPFDPFIEFWDSNHKKPEHKWDANPWVFVYEFEVLDLKNKTK